MGQSRINVHPIDGKAQWMHLYEAVYYFGLLGAREKLPLLGLKLVLLSFVSPRLPLTFPDRTA